MSAEVREEKAEQTFTHHVVIGAGSSLRVQELLVTSLLRRIVEDRRTLEGLFGVRSRQETKRD